MLFIVPERWCRHICTVLLLLVAIVCRGQDFPLIHYTTGNGLPSQTIYDIYKDSKGFLWISTDKGVARYNGIRFEKFSTFDGMSDNEIFMFREDYQRRLWMGTYSGALCFYKDGIFHTAENTPFLRLPVKTSLIEDMFVENDSSVMIRFQNLPYFVCIKNDECQIRNYSSVKKLMPYSEILFIDRLTQNSYKYFCEKMNVVADTNGHILSVDSAPWRYKLVRAAVCQKQRYIQNYDSIFNLEGKVIYTPFLPEINRRYLCRIYYDGHNYLLGSFDGLRINNNYYLLKRKFVTSITQDIEGNYWLGTIEDGIYKLNRNFFSVKEYDNVVPGKAVYAYARSGDVYFTTANNNLYRFSKGLTNCLFDNAQYYHNKTPERIPGYSGHYVDSALTYYSFYNDHNNIITGLDAKKVSVKRFRSAYTDNIKALFAIGTTIYQSIGTEIIEQHYTDVHDGDSIKNILLTGSSNKRVYSFTKDNTGHLWYASGDSVYKYNGSNFIAQRQFGTLSFRHFDIFGQYLVGYTSKFRLMVCNNINGRVNIDSSINDNCIWEDFFRLSEDQVLISTNGLYRLLTFLPSGDKPRFSLQVIENPFIPVEAEAITSDDDNCYFIKNGVITSVNKNVLLSRSNAPKLIFTFLKTKNKKYPVESNITLPYSESSSINIAFMSLSFSGKDLIYEYSISKDSSNSWKPLASEEINLFTSGYGTYIIKIRAKTLSSSFSVPAVLYVYIEKPFWATLWFILLAFILLSIVSFLIVRYSIRAAVRKKEKEHTVKVKSIKSEYMALNALMNPHFIFNSLNSIQSLINENDKWHANEYLNVFSLLVRQNIHNISKELIPLQKEIELVENYLKLEKLRFKDYLNYEIHIEDDTDTDTIKLPPLLIQPLVENAIRHGLLPKQSTNNFVRINIYERQDMLYIEIKDNGIGIHQSLKSKHNHSASFHESLGLDSIRKRIEKLHIIYNTEITFQIDEIENAGGTIAIIGIRLDDLV